MTSSSHIHRIALIAVIGCAILASWTGPAAARPIDANLPDSRTAASPAEPRVSSSADGSDIGLPIVFGGVVLLVVVGAGGYAYRTRTNRGAIA